MSAQLVSGCALHGVGSKGVSVASRSRAEIRAGRAASHCMLLSAFVITPRWDRTGRGDYQVGD